jgi:hypothetical protein
MFLALRGWWYRLTKRARVRTIRHSFSLATVAAVSLMATVLLSDGSSYIQLGTSQQSVAAGDRFTVDVYVNAHQSVNAIDIGIDFPENLVDVIGIDTGQSVISLWAQDPYVAGNTVILQGGTFRRGFIGEHLVAQINFQAKEAGRLEFGISQTTLLAGDGSGDVVPDVTAAPRLVVAVTDDGTLRGDIEITLVTDIDGDGNVTLRDINAFMNAWRTQDWQYDFNSDNRMNFTDFAIILADAFFN